MKYLFYSFAFIFFLRGLTWIASPRKKNKRILELKELVAKMKGTDYDYSDPGWEELTHRKIIDFTYLIWCFIGVLSFNWIAFAFILLLQTVVLAPLGKVIQKSFLMIPFIVFNGLILVSFSAFVTINSFHLKINLQELISQVIS